MDFVTIGVIAYLVTIALAIGWPFMNKYIQTGEAFEWRKALGKLFGALGGALLAVSMPQFTDALIALAEQYDYPSLYVLAVAGLAWTSTVVGHEGTKTAKHTKNKLS